VKHVFLCGMVMVIVLAVVQKVNILAIMSVQLVPLQIVGLVVK